MNRTSLDQKEIDEEILFKRSEFIEKIGDFDDNVAELIINEREVKNEDIRNAIRRIVIDSRALVTFCGSAYKNYGVQPLLDGIIEYLPDPMNFKRYSFFKNLKHDKDVCALAFKIVHHPTKGVLTYIRIYSGTLKEGDSVYNTSRNTSEKISRIAIAYSNEFKQVEKAE